MSRIARLLARLRPLAVGLALAGGAAFAAGSPGDAPVDFLEPEQAFQMSAKALDAHTVQVHFTVAEGYYLYRDKFGFKADNGVALGQPAFPAALRKVDPQFGATDTYRHDLIVPVPVTQAAGPFTLSVKAQGCADAGLCYPPFTRTATLTLPPDPAGEATSQAAAAAPAAPADESGRIGALLQQRNVALVLATFFGFGLLLAFTPCVFPMIPILSGIIVGHGDTITRRRALGLSIAYVLGMAVTYTLAGIAAGLSGTLLTSALQNPWVLGGFGLIFVVLSLSMFGFYDLQLPSSLQSRLSNSANRQGGSLAGVTLMGAMSALIVGPCVAAPLAGALLYIARTRDAVLGGAALFSMALGMGAPLVAVGVAARTVLPRAGAWMEGVKKFFGVLLLAVAVWLVGPVAPPVATMIAYASLLLFSGIYLRAFDPLPAEAPGSRRFLKGAGVMAAIAGGAILVGALAGSRDPWQPLAGLRSGPQQAVTAPMKFEPVRTVAELQERLLGADRPVMLDFYADWCVSCKEMEHLTFSDPQVRAKLDRMLVLQADVTANSEADRALLKRFSLFGPPGIVFFERGSPREARRVVGYQPAQVFGPLVDAVLSEPGSIK